MMLDAYLPEGVTMLAVDSIFMMPQLGVLSAVHPEAAAQVFERDCLIKLGHVIAPVGRGKPGEIACSVTIGGETHDVEFGAVKLIPLGVGETAGAVIRPRRKFNVGAGSGMEVTREVEGGAVGLIIDCRGRPLVLPTDSQARIRKLVEWHTALGLTPDT
jgi:hypothetical protein